MKRVDIALAVPVRGGRVLVARREVEQHQGGLWEFPGGKVSEGEAPPDAARRELFEETGLTAERIEPLVMVVHDYAELPLRLHVYLVTSFSGEPSIEGREWGWKSRAELAGLTMPAANARILRALRWRLGDGA